MCRRLSPCLNSYEFSLIVPYVVAGIAGTVAACAVDARFIEPRRLVLERRDIPIARLPPAFDGYRIAIMSDFHYPRWTDSNAVRRAVHLANTFDPDLIVLAGDICDKTGEQPAIAPSLAGLFEDARARDGIVGVRGNHDHYYPAESLRREFAEHTPVRLIENTSFLIMRHGQQIAVGGVGDLWRGEVCPEKAFEGVPADIPRLLVSHNPDLAERIAPDLRIDLMLSGHTHGGQVHLPGFPAPWITSRYGKKFRAGLCQGKGCQVYVSRGVCSTRHLRFLCPPEVSALTLRPGSAAHSLCRGENSHV